MSTENNKPKIETLKAKAKSANSVTKRRRLITTFYQLMRSGAEVKMFNEDLQKDIYITNKSLGETVKHASIKEKSTLAVFELLDILKNAKKVSEEPVKTTTKRQQQYKKMVILEDNVKGIGKVKLTVGLTKAENKHIQYCITALE